MGSTARSKLARYIMGDTVQYTMKHSDLPLFLAQ